MNPNKTDIQRFLIPLFTFIWWDRLWFEHPFDDGYYRAYVYKVKGWRTAIIDRGPSGFGRMTVTFEFNWWKRST